MMPHNFGIHIIQFPSGRFGFVGTLPAALGDIVPATTADIMGGRAETNPQDGKAYTVKFPSFKTKQDAKTHLVDRLQLCELCGESAGEGGAICPACQESR